MPNDAAEPSNLEVQLKELLQTRGPIPFDDYMNLCLYDEDHGYYTTERSKVGKSGDFYTSSFIGSIMGEMLVRYAVRSDWAHQLLDGAEFSVVEWGGGTGRLAKHILDELQQAYPALYDRIHFTSIEHNDTHRRMQQQECSVHIQRMRWITEEQWFAERNSNQAPMLVFSNELLDAFPVKRAVNRNGEWREIYVSWSQEHRMLVEEERELTPQLAAYLNDAAFTGRHNQHIEANIRGLEWYSRVAAALSDGSTMISIDYGDKQEELWGSHRMQGTLMCYYRHQGHDNPYIRIGEQDMTAHVNFTDFKTAGEHAGMHTEQLFSQKDFLMEAGVLELLTNHMHSDPFHPAARRNRSIRQLLLSDGMSELFKVLVQRKQSGSL